MHHTPELGVKLPKDRHILSIIREDGVHISFFPIDSPKLRNIAKDDFWVLKDKNI